MGIWSALAFFWVCGLGDSLDGGGGCGEWMLWMLILDVFVLCPQVAMMMTQPPRHSIRHMPQNTILDSPHLELLVPISQTGPEVLGAMGLILLISESLSCLRVPPDLFQTSF